MFTAFAFFVQASGQLNAPHFGSDVVSVVDAGGVVVGLRQHQDGVQPHCQHGLIVAPAFFPQPAGQVNVTQVAGVVVGAGVVVIGTVVGARQQ
jgi:hypothetical protein